MDVFPAVADPARHPRVLREAGAVSGPVDAQRRVHRLEPGPLDDLAA